MKTANGLCSPLDEPLFGDLDRPIHRESHDVKSSIAAETAGEIGESPVPKTDDQQPAFDWADTMTLDDMATVDFEHHPPYRAYPSLARHDGQPARTAA